MNGLDQIAEALKQAGATNVQVTRGDSNTEYEVLHRITWVYQERSYELSGGLVRQHGSISK